MNYWNSLEEAVVTAESVNSFKTGLEASWKEKELKYDATGYWYFSLPSGPVRVI